MRKHFRNLRTHALIAAWFVLAACGGRGSGGTTSAVDSSAGASVTAATPAAAISTGMRGEAAPATAPAPAPRAERGSSSAGDLRASDARAFAASPGVAGVDPAGAMLVRQGQASIEVRRLDDAVTRVRQQAAQLGGFVANASVRSGRDEARAATLEVRVPSAQFDALVGALGGVGRVESVTASAQDVGDEYVDLAARAANARRLEARLIEILGTRTGKLSEVLTLEQELARVREEIERYDGRLKHLERTASLSSLAISLHEPLPLVERPDAGPIAEAFGAAWERMVAMLAWCIASLGVLVPLGVLGLAGFFVVQWLRRRFPAAGHGSV